MYAQDLDLTRYPPPSRWRAARLRLCIATSLLWALPAAADQAPNDKAKSDETVDGLFVTVRTPIDTLGVNRVKAITNRFLDRPDHRGLKIVYDFNPDDHATRPSDYGTCRDLAVF